MILGSFWVVQGSVLPPAGDMGVILGCRTNIPHAVRCSQSNKQKNPLSYFLYSYKKTFLVVMISQQEHASHKGSSSSLSRGEEETQEEVPGTEPQFLFHECEMPRIIHNHHHIFSHTQTVVLYIGYSTVLCQPTGEKARLTEGCSFRAEAALKVSCIKKSGKPSL